MAKFKQTTEAEETTDNQEVVNAEQQETQNEIHAEQVQKPKPTLAHNHFIARNKENKEVYIQITEGAFSQLQEFWERVEDEKEIEKAISTLIGVDNTGYVTSDCTSC